MIACIQDILCTCHMSWLLRHWPVEPGRTRSCCSDKTELGNGSPNIIYILNVQFSKNEVHLLKLLPASYAGAIELTMLSFNCLGLLEVPGSSGCVVDFGPNFHKKISTDIYLYFFFF
jgi:hypothetical protein